jgi:DNA-nicking Smr family endonuclease
MLLEENAMKTSEWLCTPFKGLKEALENNEDTFNKKNIIENRTDEEVFLDAMADVREIREFREIPFKRPPSIKYRHVQTDDSLEVLNQIVKGEIKMRLSDTGEYMEWISPAMRKDLAQRLHQGDFSVQDYIDLHGMTLHEAKEAFGLFFKDAIRKRLFCVKVIHGRGLRSPGGPVLKEALQKWLQGSFRKWVLAYSTAKDCDGGLGAAYIILNTK